MLKVKIMHLSDLSEQIFNSWLRFASLCIVSSLGTPFYIKQVIQKQEIIPSIILIKSNKRTTIENCDTFYFILFF